MVQFAPFQPHSSSTTTLLDVSATLRQRLRDNALEFIQVDGDGSYFFTAIATNMASNRNKWTHTLRMVGWTNDITIDVNIRDLSILLRQAGLCKRIIRRAPSSMRHLSLTVTLAMFWKLKNSWILLFMTVF